ncbi:NUDIX domain-containing protein [Reyranella sp.]|uniref:NUDIX domain-containing protein n=1 Tax=Reyranella sp. TaxID=1929291 RepID=UPI003D0ED0BB
MPKKQSAGIIVYRMRSAVPELLLVHPGGPFWARKDDGAWSIPKGELVEGEEKLQAARREFTEETGFTLDGAFEELVPVRQPGGKTIYSWAIEQELDASLVRSNLFTIEWPPRSGRRQEFPEVDRAGWFAWPLALRKVLKGQRPILVQVLTRHGVAEASVAATLGELETADPKKAGR